MTWDVGTVLVLGAGNGGKASAVDMAIQGVPVRLYESEPYKSALEGIPDDLTFVAKGDVKGEAKLKMVTTDLSKALDGVKTIMVCTVVQAHAHIAKALAPFMTPEHVIILNPGSTGGSLQFAKIFREAGLKALPTLAELGTLTYGCRSKGNQVNVSVKVSRVEYSTLPADKIEVIGPALEKLFPGLTREPTVLAAGLANANPVIHPAITLLNLGRMEQQGSDMLFYRDGVSPMVANMIEALDKERMALMKALGYEAKSDPELSVMQGYTDTSESYYACYHGPAYSTFACPDGSTLMKHRYFYEDIGQGLVLYCSLGKALGVPTPVSRAIIEIGSVVAQHDFWADQARTVETLGIQGLKPTELREYLRTGILPATGDRAEE